jgi:CelD/BcsL family acetyltransferase involved in cellulose biosynthesis
MLETLIQWKTSQFVRTGVRNLFVEPWIGEFIRRLHWINTPGFAGIFSVLKVGEHPLAMALTLRSTSVLHGSFMAYDSAYARYSPGMLVLVEMIQYAASAGLQSVDLGKGDMLYKQQLANGAVPLCEGSVECSASLALMRRLRSAAAGAVRSSPLRRPARFVKQWVQKGRSWIAQK